MNRCFFLRKEDRDPQWHHIDATGETLGRLATRIADTLRGKGKVNYTPHTDNGDYVVVTNCTAIVVTGNKEEDKEYIRYSGWRSGKKVRTYKEQISRDPISIIKLAVKGMLPKNRISSQAIRRLKIYVGAEHPHQAQLSK